MQRAWARHSANGTTTILARINGRIEAYVYGDADLARMVIEGMPKTSEVPFEYLRAQLTGRES